MPQEVISKNTQDCLALLDKRKILKDFYLAGGTGLALQLNHRISIDLDFFTSKNFNPEKLREKIKNLGKFSVEKEEEDILIGIFNKTRISFFVYNYPALFSFKKFHGISVADPRDIGCMKISAIASRGSKKDFVDVFFICQKVISLQKLLKLFEKKYKEVDYNMTHILKSLVCFEDAEKDPMPKMLIKVSWKDIKKFFQEEIKKLA